MKLKEYLDKNYISKKKFSILTGISESTIIRICRGRSCRIENAEIINKFTKGQVTSKDLASSP